MLHFVIGADVGNEALADGCGISDGRLLGADCVEKLEKLGASKIPPILEMIDFSPSIPLNTDCGGFRRIIPDYRDRRSIAKTCFSVALTAKVLLFFSYSMIGAQRWAS